MQALYLFIKILLKIQMYYKKISYSNHLRQTSSIRIWKQTNQIQVSFTNDLQ